jgi:YaiO family outer membrane protein
VISRHGALRDTRSGPLKTTIIDGRPSFGAFYHYSGGGWVGATFGASAPALALPRYAVGISAFAPLGRVLSLHLSTAYWQYIDDRDVVIVSPALGIAVTDSVDVTARYWLTSVVVRGSGSTSTVVDYVHSAGIRVGWRPNTRLTLGADYTYGIQLERNPSATDLLQLRSHIFSVFARKLLDRSFGVDVAFSLERRTSLGSGPTVVGAIAEAGVFTRW